MERRCRILVAPLDWGLGHTTRCIPIIKALLQRKAEVIIGGSGSAGQLLKLEFPALKYFALPAYNPQYNAEGNMVWDMATQLPHFIKTIYTEHARLKTLIKNEGIDIVISDNRYGCYSPLVKSIFIGHQLHILMPEFFKWMEPIVNSFNRRQIAKFDECWIPASGNELLGNLLPSTLPVHTRFIGYLSRFKKRQEDKKYDIAAIASGPDPQKTRLVDMLRSQLKASNLKTILVCGEVDGDEKIEAFGNYSEANFMGTEKLNHVIAQSDIIIARPGYSTIMDMAKLGKKAVFIPTPGQTEQEHFASLLMARGIAFSAGQFAFNLDSAIKESNKFGGFTNFGYDETLLDRAIQSIL